MNKQVVYSPSWLRVTLLCMGLLTATMFQIMPAVAEETAATGRNSDLDRARTLYKQALQSASQSQDDGSNPQTIVDLFTEAANLGYAPAQVDLGQIYYYGLAGMRDDNQAVFWFQKAAEQGDAKGQYLLGRMYTEGKGGLQESESQALIWYEKAAAQGYDPAQYYLAILYLAGIDGIEKDRNKAVDLLQKAAKQGNKEAHELLIKLQLSQAILQPSQK